MSGNVKERLILNVKASRFYDLQLDESIDISNDANLLECVRYEHNDATVGDFLFSRPLPSHATVSTDGARTKTGTRTGLQARVKKTNPSIVWHHCCIHREALADKNMPEKLKTVLDDIIQVVNFNKAWLLNSRIFESDITSEENEIDEDDSDVSSEDYKDLSDESDEN
ncbi:SCAN domain-containing protein 3 [Eumeta japonica]|uniref:SCAN domain-containing protein 3 n=1 Tax=Eumeta variegata TaxID=151549 RepID=A0A4C1VDY8_EUMVA|nr:SCAN domain-containing protein 3 [Eumeta japonica]